MRVVVEFEIDENWLRYMKRDAPHKSAEAMTRQALNVNPHVAAIKEIRTHRTIDVIEDIAYYDGASEAILGEDN